MHVILLVNHNVSKSQLILIHVGIRKSSCIDMHELLCHDGMIVMLHNSWSYFLLLVRDILRLNDFSTIFLHTK